MDPKSAKIGPKIGCRKYFSRYNALSTSVPTQNLLGTRFWTHFGPILGRFWSHFGPNFDKLRLQNRFLTDFYHLKGFAYVRSLGILILFWSSVDSSLM